MANLIRISAIACKLGGIHESYAWKRLSADPNAPKPIKLGERLTVFDEADVDRWIGGLVKEGQAKPAKTIRKPKHSAASAT